jgi:hypothetical protein
LSTDNSLRNCLTRRKEYTPAPEIKRLVCEGEMWAYSPPAHADLPLEEAFRASSPLTSTVLLFLFSYS